MRSRQMMQTKLETLLGSRNVYFAPPESVKMKYPCFVYNYSRFSTRRANDKAYTVIPHYDVTYISKNPDSGMIERMLEAYEMCSHIDSYMTENLNHDKFDVYY